MSVQSIISRVPEELTLPEWDILLPLIAMIVHQDSESNIILSLTGLVCECHRS